jgi:pimeloyl-ACP methyl ester carboxylesterase
MNMSVFKTEEGREELFTLMDSVMARWSYPYERSFVSTRFGDTHVVTAGDRERPALLLLHGAASNILSWGAEIPRYMGEFFVIAPDIPGEAGKSAPLRPSWENDDYADWLEDLLDAFGINTVSILGISFGGWVALKVAAHRPAKVTRIALLTPGGIVLARASAIWKTILYSMDQKHGAEKMKRIVFGTEDVLPEVSRFFNLVLKHYNPRFGSPPLLTDAELAAITARVMMLSGDRDAFFAVEKAAKRLKAVLPVAAVTILAQGAHGITDPGEGIRQFLCNREAQTVLHID